MIQYHGQKYVDEIKPRKFKLIHSIKKGKRKKPRCSCVSSNIRNGDYAVALRASSFLPHLALRYKLYPVYILPLEQKVWLLSYPYSMYAQNYSSLCIPLGSYYAFC